MFRQSDYLSELTGLDPLAEQQKRLLAQQATGTLNPQGQPTPLAPAEAESTLSKVANAGLGALHYVGGTIDKTFGGRAIRAGVKGLMGGDIAPSELLSMLPFSDALGVTDERNRVSGEDILEQSGALEGEGTKGTFELRDLAGPALELALDPSTYLTLGTTKALTSAGQAASKAGILPSKATARLAGFAAGTPEAAALAARMAVPEAEVAGKALSGLASVGLPFAEKTVLGTGDGAKALAGFLEKKADGLLYSRVGTALSRLFDPKVHGAVSPEAQRVGREFYDPALVKAGAAALDPHVAGGKLVADAGLLTQESGPRLRRLLENVPDAAGPATPAEQAAVDFIRAKNKTMLDQAQGVGRGISELDDPAGIGYAHRQMTAPKADTPGHSGGYRIRDLDPGAGAQARRQDLLRGFVGGTEGVNDLARDPLARHLVDNGALGSARAHIAENYLGMGNAELTRMQQLKTAPALTAAESAELANLQGRWSQALDLGDWVKDLDPAYARDGLSFFGNHPLTDHALGMLGHERAQAGSEAIHRLLADSAVHSPTGGASNEMVSAFDALRSAKLDHGTGPERLASLLQQAGVVQPGMALHNVFVPGSVVGDAIRYGQVATTPEALSPVMKAFDSLTNLTKAGQTTAPSFHSRNMMTGLWQNAVIGARDPNYHPLNPMGYIRPFMDAMALRNNGVVPGAAMIFEASHPGITDAQATRLLHEEMFVNSARHGTSSGALQQAVGKGNMDRTVPLQLPGTGGEQTIAETLNPLAVSKRVAEDPVTAAQGQWNPLNVRGVGIDRPAEASAFLPVRYSQEAGALGDDLNRMSAFVALRRQGVDAAEAAARSRAAHYDYSKLTDFERNFMRRVLPFYGWTRNNLPFQLEELASRPGGLSSSTLKGIDSLRQSEGFVPDSVSEGLAVPIGQEADGKSRFLTHFGLPIEDAFSLMGTGESPVARTGQKVVGMANPILKLPAEMIAGKQMYSGRNLDDLYSVTGNQTLEQLLMNSPASRLWTTGRQLLDDRKDVFDKALNLVGPGKITDVDTDKARQVAGRDAIEALLKSQGAARTFDTLYVPREQLGNLSPEQMQLYRLYKYLEAQRLAQNKAAGQKAKEQQQ